MENSSAKVQHVTKASSDELLTKFAQMGSPKRDSRVSKRLKTTTTEVADSRSFNSVAVVEKRSLLPAPVTRRRYSSALIRHLGRGRFSVGSKGFRNRSILGTIHKTWRKTFEGATKVLMEKHYNGHKRLINDIGKFDDQGQG